MQSASVLWLNLNNSTIDLGTGANVAQVQDIDSVSKDTAGIVITTDDFGVAETYLSKMRHKTALVPVVICTSASCSLWQRFYNVYVCPRPSSVLSVMTSMGNDVQLLLKAILLANSGYYRHSYRHLNPEEKRRGDLIDPYTRRRFEEYRYNGQCVSRPNHGILHAIRKCSYIVATVQFWSRHHYKNSSSFRRFKSPTEILKLQLLALFRVAGRLSELGFSPDKPQQNKTYEYYRERSADALVKTVKANSDLFGLWNHNEQDLLSDASLLTAESSRDKRITILKTVHDLDLRRCKTEDEYHHYLGIAFTKAKRSSETMNKDKEELVQMALSTIAVSGERWKKTTKRDGRTFIPLSHHPKQAFDTIFNHQKGKNNVKREI